MSSSPTDMRTVGMLYVEGSHDAEFTRMQSCHEISRETLILLLSTAIQTKIVI